MLVLSRKLGECILIGGDIQVTVLDVSGDGVKLGVSAPRDIPIYRPEVLSGMTDRDKADHGSPTEVVVDLARLLAKGRSVRPPKLHVYSAPPDKQRAAPK